MEVSLKSQPGCAVRLSLSSCSVDSSNNFKSYYYSSGDADYYRDSEMNISTVTVRLEYTATNIFQKKCI